MSAAVQQLFARLRTGDESALSELTPTLYNELRHIAARHMRGERHDHTLQPTALAHEAYLKLLDGTERQFVDEVHFLAVASRAMRQVLVDYARARASLKRSAVPASGAPRTTSLEVQAGEGVELLDLIELDSAMRELAEENETLAKLVEMRYFGGLTAEETAQELGQSVHIVRHDLRYAQVWLRRRLARGGAGFRAAPSS
ncbi:MAG TPA: ECF-type sigma factor [Candidatus Acidoferrales bacterium]|nr:ECF-type sigma factor [Candidatus Acidoferrales bacterium]